MGHSFSHLCMQRKNVKRRMLSQTITRRQHSHLFPSHYKHNVDNVKNMTLYAEAHKKKQNLAYIFHRNYVLTIMNLNVQPCSY